MYIYKAQYPRAALCAVQGQWNTTTSVIKSTMEIKQQQPQHHRIRGKVRKRKRSKIKLSK
jgi:hypothetical protein